MNSFTDSFSTGILSSIVCVREREREWAGGRASGISLMCRRILALSRRVLFPGSQFVKNRFMRRHSHLLSQV